MGSTHSRPPILGIRGSCFSPPLALLFGLRSTSFFTSVPVSVTRQSRNTETTASIQHDCLVSLFVPYAKFCANLELTCMLWRCTMQQLHQGNRWGGRPVYSMPSQFVAGKRAFTPTSVPCRRGRSTSSCFHIIMGVSFVGRR